MKIVILVLLLSFGAVSMAQETGTITQAEFDSETLGRPYQYNVYLPAGYDAGDTVYPVIYLLHGRGDSMAGWTNIKNTLDTMIANGDVPPLIAVMPDMPSSDRAGYYVDSQYSGNAAPPAEAVETAFFNDLIPHIDATYKTAPQRSARLVGGYSMGGYGALRYALAHPEMFVGALVLSPAVYIPFPPVDSSTREFGAFGLGDSLFDDDTYTALNYPVLLPAFRQTALGLSMFIAVGDDEWKNERPEDALHDLDVEAHMVFNQVARVPSIQSEFRVYDGGHDWDVWTRGFAEGLPFLMRAVRVDSDTVSQSPITPVSGEASGDGQNFAGGIAPNSDGGTVSARAANSAAGDLDIAITKHDAGGTVMWMRQIASPANDRAYGVAVDAQDNVIVAGYTAGNLDGAHAAASDDAFVMKLNSDGEIRWALQFGDAAEADRLYGLTVAPDGQIYVTGYSKGVLGGELFGDKDIIVAQISPDGEIVWLDQFGGTGEDKAYVLTLDGENLYIAGGIGTATGGLDAYLAAYTVSGEQRWMQTFGTPDWDEAYGVAVGADGAVYVSGFVSGDFDGHPSLGDRDAFIIAFDAGGSRIASQQFGSAGNDKGVNVVIAPSGDISVSAISDGGVETTLGGFDVLVARFDAALNPLDVAQYGSEADDGADEYAEPNLFMTLAGDSLLLYGISGAGTFSMTADLNP